MSGDRVTVLQVIGRLSYRNVKIAMPDGSDMEATLSGDAYCNHLMSNGVDCRLVIAAPESIVTFLAEDPATASELIENKDKLRNSLNCSIRERILSQSNMDIIILPSVGHYRKRGGTYSLKFEGAKIGDIRLKILLDLLPDALSGRKIVVDTSTGHNIYVGAAVRALRDLQVLAALNTISESLEKEMSPPDYGIATTEPITDDSGGSAEYLVDEVTAEAFFHYPLSKDDISSAKDNIIRDTSCDPEGTKTEQIKRRWSYLKLNMWLSIGRKLFNSLAFNAPLAFLELSKEIPIEKGFKPPSDSMKDLVKELSEYINAAIAEVIGADINVRKCSLNRSNITRALIGLTIANSLVDLAEKVRGELSIDDGYYLGRIPSVFIEIYRNLKIRGPSHHTLSVEAQKIAKIANEMLAGEPQKWHKLVAKQIPLSEEKDKETEIHEGSIKRNFFAHSGFLYNLTEARKCNSEIIVRYGSTKELNWKKFIEEPE